MKGGETTTFVVNLAVADQKTEFEELQNLIDRVHVIITRTRRLLGKGDARDAWENFAAGFIRFHLQDRRYQLADVLPELKS